MRSSTRIRPLLLAALLGPLLALSAAAAGNLYMTIKGGAAGTRGQTAEEAGTQRFPVMQCTGLSSSPGMNAALRQFKITKEPGTGSARLRAALANGEVLKEVALEFFHRTADGTEQVYYTLKLTGVKVTGVRDLTATVGFGRQKQLEEFSLTFQKVQPVTTPGARQSGDGWDNQ